MTPEQSEIEFREITLEDITDEFVVAMSGLMTELKSRSSSSSEKALNNAANNDSTFTFIALADGKLVGTATANVLMGPEGEKAKIDTVITTNSHRGRGIYTGLMNRAEVVLADNGYELVDGTDLTELSSSEKRAEARRLYEERGYIEKDTHFYEKRI